MMCKKGFSKNLSYSVIHDRNEAIHYAVQQAKAKDIVLIAGKRS